MYSLIVATEQRGVIANGLRNMQPFSQLGRHHKRTRRPVSQCMHRYSATLLSSQEATHTKPSQAITLIRKALLFTIALPTMSDALVVLLLLYLTSYNQANCH